MSKAKPLPPPENDFDFKNDINLIIRHRTDLEVSQLVKEYNERYLYWDEVQRRKMPEGLDHESFWKLMKYYRLSRANNIKISDLPGFNFHYNMTDNIAKQLHRFDLNLGGVLESSANVPEGQSNKYMISSLMEEAIASSQLEGAATTRKVAKEMLRSERKPRNTSERMILNNYLTIQEVKKFSKSKLTPELICKFHKTITEGTLDHPTTEGSFRTNNEVQVVDNITGEVYYTPPNHEIIQKAILDICEFANSQKGNDFIHPIIRAITLHFLIGYLHPFVDGNGRTARALFYWHLLSKGYWLAEYISISKVIIESPSQYSRAYICTEDDQNDLTYFYHYNFKCLMKATKQFRNYTVMKVREKTKLYDLQRIKGLNERQIEVIQKVQKEKHKFFSIKEIQNTFDIVYQTARTDLLELEKIGYLIQKKSGRKILFHRSHDFDNVLKKGLKEDL